MDNILPNAVNLLSNIWDMFVSIYSDLMSWSFDLGGNTYGIGTIFTSAFFFLLIGILVINWVVPN